MNILVQWATRNGEYVKAKAIQQRVTHVYDDGRVRTESGDVWHVRKTREGYVALPKTDHSHVY